MKIGLNSMVFCDCYHKGYLPWVEIAASLGYDLLEIVVGNEDVDVKSLKQSLQQHSVDCALSCGMTPQQNLASEDATVRAAGHAHIARCCALAAELGSPTLSGPLFFSGSQPFPRSSVQRQQEWTRVTQELATAAVTASGYDITLCIEPMNRYKTDLVNTVAQARTMIEQTGCHNLQILYDTYHSNIEEADFATSILLAGSLLGEVHLCDNHKGAPGSGHIPFLDILTSLRQVHYSGAVIFESFLPNGKDNIWQPLAVDAYILAGEAVQAVRRLMAEARW